MDSEEKRIREFVLRFIEVISFYYPIHKVILGATSC